MINKDDDLPSINPNRPGIYRLLIDEAEKIRRARIEKRKTQKLIMDYLNETRMREAREFDEELERQASTRHRVGIQRFK